MNRYKSVKALLLAAALTVPACKLEGQDTRKGSENATIDYHVPDTGPRTYFDVEKYDPTTLEYDSGSYDAESMPECDIDMDKDRVCPPEDCNDDDYYVNPNVQELCNYKDDNCDYFIDEGFNTGETCYNGVGACQTQGIYVCQDEKTTVCNAPDALPPGEEVCNSIDDDCDGTVDEGLEPLLRDCSVGVGECYSEGTEHLECQGVDGYADFSGCDAPRILGVEEICDDLDNDCDGEVDEDATITCYDPCEQTYACGEIQSCDEVICCDGEEHIIDRCIETVAYKIMIDDSGSMVAIDPNYRRVMGLQALLAVRDQSSPTSFTLWSDHIIVDYEYHNSNAVLLSWFSQSRNFPHGGGTNLQMALDHMIDSLAQRPERRQGVIITDGQAPIDIQGTRQRLVQENIRLTVVGFGNGVNHQALRQLAGPEGEYFHIRGPDDFEGIYENSVGPPQTLEVCVDGIAWQEVVQECN